MDQDQNRHLSPSELRTGDVLLSLGSTWESEWIVKLTGGDYSHSALFDGKKVFEAIKKGVVRSSLKEHITAQTGGVDVYRFKSKNGDRLGRPGWSPDPIIEVAKYYWRRRTQFAFNQLFMLIPLVIARRIPGQPAKVKEFLRRLLDNAAEALNEVGEEGKQPMICSEFVYRCFSQAVPVPQYTLTLQEFSMVRGYQALSSRDTSATEAKTMGTEDPELREYMQEAHAIAKEYFKARGYEIPDAGHAQEFSRHVIPDFVTPADLQVSSNLEKLGSLSERRLILESSSS